MTTAKQDSKVKDFYVNYASTTLMLKYTDHHLKKLPYQNTWISVRNMSSQKDNQVALLNIYKCTLNIKQNNIVMERKRFYISSITNPYCIVL